MTKPVPKYSLNVQHAAPQITASEAIERSQERVTLAADRARQEPDKWVSVAVWTPEEFAALEREHGEGTARLLFSSARAQLQNAGYRSEENRGSFSITLKAGDFSRLE